MRGRGRVSQATPSATASNRERAARRRAAAILVPDPATGVTIYNSIPDANGESGWSQIGGTSAGAPQWAGLLAVINEGRAIIGKPTLDGVKDVLPWLSTYPSNNFRDIITGTNGFEATPGIDYATGIGSPRAHKVARALILWDTPGTVIT